MGIQEDSVHKRKFYSQVRLHLASRPKLAGNKDKFNFVTCCVCFSWNIVIFFITLSVLLWSLAENEIILRIHLNTHYCKKKKKKKHMAIKSFLSHVSFSVFVLMTLDLGIKKMKLWMWGPVGRVTEKHHYLLQGWTVKNTSDCVLVASQPLAGVPFHCQQC